MERVKFDGDLWSLKPGDLLTDAEEMQYPEDQRVYDTLMVIDKTQDGEWIPVSYHSHGSVAVLNAPSDLISVGEIALVRRAE